MGAIAGRAMYGPAIAGDLGRAHMMGGYGMSDGFGLGWILMILWGVLIVVGIAALVKWMLDGQRSDDRKALDILKARYARGEIDEEAFRKMKRDLSQ